MARLRMTDLTRSSRLRRRVRVGAPIAGLMILGCSAAVATAMFDPAQPPRANGVGTVARPDKAQTGVINVGTVARPDKAHAVVSPVAPKVEAKLVSMPTPLQPPQASPSPAGAVRQIPLIAGVDTTPATPPQVRAVVAAAGETPSLPSPVVQPVPAAAARPSVTAVASSSKAPLECLPEGLRIVLDEVQARFGAVEVVSTKDLQTDNHSHGSTRHKLHTNCKAVDFKVAGDLDAVTAYLRSRPEVAGVNSYRNNRVIHIDAAEGRRLAQR